MNKKIDQYILDHISQEDPVLEDLYRQTYIRFINPNMVSGHLQGKFLEFISTMINPKSILEIGTFTGYSAICLAKGLKPDGKLITIEMNDEIAAFSHSYFIRAGLESKIIQITGNALKIIPALDEVFDLVFIDGDKREYCEYFRMVSSKVRRGGFILADNVLWGGQVVDKNVKDPQLKSISEFNEMIKTDTSVDYMINPIRDGLMIIKKK